MATMTTADMADLVIATRGDAHFEGTLTEIASRLTDYTHKKLFSKEKVQIQSGERIKGNLLTNHNYSARMVGLGEVSEYDIPNLLARWSLNWRHTRNYWSWERREALMNRKRDEIFGIIKARRAGAKISAAELFETQVWGAPTDDSNELDIYGIPWWVPKASTNTAGFNGGNPTGFDDCAGIDCDAADGARWKSYNAQYAEVTEFDLLRKMRTGYRKINFKSPVDMEDARRGTAEDYRVYMNEETIELFETEARARNDNHGGDLAKFMDATSFKKRPLEYVPKLDEDTQNPVYFINWQWAAVFALEGDFPHEYDPMTDVHQPSVLVIPEDYSWNLGFFNRRCQAVFNLAS